MGDYLSKHLGTIAVEEHTLLTTQSTNLLQRLHYSNLIIHSHHRDKASLICNRIFKFFQGNKTILLHRQVSDFETSFRKPAATV